MKKYVLGIELGSTRIKSVLVDDRMKVLAQGAYEWKSELRDGLWSYEMDEVWQGLRGSYAALAAEYAEKTGEPLCEVAAIGVSAMMHGYLAFDGEDQLLVPFRTWQNTNTAEAAEALSRELNFNVPLRWSLSHFYQAVLSGEEHVSRVAHLNTLAGYVHYRLTGKRVLGVGDASGMFPLEGSAYHPRMLEVVNRLLAKKGVEKTMESLLPEILVAGEEGGRLTEEGARLLDPTGALRAGCLLCPPEGDAGTGMIATNSVRPRTANVSAGTSAFLMAVMERELSRPYSEIDVVATPMGDPVAMIHVNNFTPEINAWVDLFAETITLGGGSLSRGELFDRLYAVSAEADGDLGGLVAYNFRAGEPIAGADSGAPLLARGREGRLSLANLMRAQIYSALGSLALGMEILRDERVALDSVCGHGGFFKGGALTQSAMSAAIGAPVTVMETAGEGGAYGVALLAWMSVGGRTDGDAFLREIFGDAKCVTVAADEEEKRSFADFLARYRCLLPVERMSAELLN